MTSPQPAAGGRRAVPAPLAGACLLVVLEAAALVVAAAVLVIDVVRGPVPSVVATLAMALFFVGFAAMLVGAARALWRGRRWGRGPVVTWQVLQAASVLALPGLGRLLVAVVVGASVAVVLGVLWPTSREHASATGAPDAVL